MQKLKTADVHMNQCLICVHIRMLLANPVLMGQVMKEANIRRKLIIRYMKWYHIHGGTQVVPAWVTKYVRYLC